MKYSFPCTHSPDSSAKHKHSFTRLQPLPNKNTCFPTALPDLWDLALLQLIFDDHQLGNSKRWMMMAISLFLCFVLICTLQGVLLAFSFFCFTGQGICICWVLRLSRSLIPMTRRAGKGGFLFFSSVWTALLFSCFFCSFPCINGGSFGRVLYLGLQKERNEKTRTYQFNNVLVL